VGGDGGRITFLRHLASFFPMFRRALGKNKPNFSGGGLGGKKNKILEGKAGTDPIKVSRARASYFGLLIFGKKVGGVRGLKMVWEGGGWNWTKNPHNQSGFRPRLTKKIGEYPGGREGEGGKERGKMGFCRRGFLALDFFIHLPRTGGNGGGGARPQVKKQKKKQGIFGRPPTPREGGSAWAAISFKHRKAKGGAIGKKKKHSLRNLF